LAIAYQNKGPQEPVYEWMEEETDENESENDNIGSEGKDDR
jgi:hypothetical protein